jgi:hypothetical protein
MPSLQETFDPVVAHLRCQQAKAQIPGLTLGEFMCVYRAPDGKRCAAGALIPDDRYDPVLEYTAVGGTDRAHDYRTNSVTLLIEELGHDIELVKALQAVHDDAAVAAWETKLQQVAADFGLRYSPPPNHPGGPVC